MSGLQKMENYIFVAGQEVFYRAVTGIDEGTHDPEPLRNYKAYWSEAGVDRLKKQVTHIRACITQDGVILEEMAGFAPEDGEKRGKASDPDKNTVLYP